MLHNDQKPSTRCPLRQIYHRVAEPQFNTVPHRDHVTGDTWKNKPWVCSGKQALLGRTSQEPSAALAQDMRVPEISVVARRHVLTLQRLQRAGEALQAQPSRQHLLKDPWIRRQHIPNSFIAVGQLEWSSAFSHCVVARLMSCLAKKELISRLQANSASKCTIARVVKASPWPERKVPRVLVFLLFCGLFLVSLRDFRGNCRTRRVLGAPLVVLSVRLGHCSQKSGLRGRTPFHLIILM